MLTKPISLTHAALVREHAEQMKVRAAWTEDFCRRWNAAAMEPLTQETVSDIAKVA